MAVYLLLPRGNLSLWGYCNGFCILHVDLGLSKFRDWLRLLGIAATSLRFLVFRHNFLECIDVEVNSTILILLCLLLEVLNLRLDTLLRFWLDWNCILSLQLSNRSTYCERLLNLRWLVPRCMHLIGNYLLVLGILLMRILVLRKSEDNFINNLMISSCCSIDLSLHS